MAEVNKAHHCTPVADDWNWTTRIRNELGAHKAWQRNWGFLIDMDGKQPAGAAADGVPAAAGGDALSSFMQKTSSGSKPATSSSTESLSYIAAKQRDSARARRLEQQDSLDGFVSTYMVKGDPRARELPAKEFRKPLTTSHEYGWGRNLEVFGKMTLVLK